MKKMLVVSTVSLLFAAAAFCQPPKAPPPEHAGPPLPRHAVTNRAFTGISSLAVAPNGRLWVTWYAGHTPGEDRNNYVVLATSGDGGATWKELLTVDPDGGGNVAPSIPKCGLRRMVGYAGYGATVPCRTAVCRPTRSG